MTTARVAAALEALLDTPVERHLLDRGGRTLSRVEVGSGPALLFEAGAGSPVAGFAAVFKQLMPDHRLVAYDRAGYGGSDGTPLSVQLQLDDLIAILEATRARVVVGHSWGGLLAQLATWSRPDLIAGLVLLDPSHEGFWSPVPTLPSEDVRRADHYESAHQQATATAHACRTTPEIEHLLVDACLSYIETPTQVDTHLTELPMILDHVAELTTRRTKAVWPPIPIATFTATKGRPADNTQRVLALQQQLPATHTVVPDSGHSLHLDRPDLVATAVREVVRGAA